MELLGLIDIFGCTQKKDKLLFGFILNVSGSRWAFGSKFIYLFFFSEFIVIEHETPPVD